MTQPSDERARRPAAAAHDHPGAAPADRPAAEEEREESEALAAEIELFSAERMIFFTDAVVAIAITLLALGLPLPHGLSNAEVLQSIRARQSDYLAFGISFLVIGGYWRMHHRLFRFVARLSARLMTLNMFWLFFIVIIPFAARVLAGNGGFGVRFGLYAMVQVLVALTSLGLMRLLRTDGLLRPDAPPVPPHASLGLCTVAVMFAVSIPVAFVTSYAYLCWVAAPLAAKLIRRAQGLRTAAAARGRT